MKTQEQDIYEVIRSRNNLVDYCEKHGIDLTRIGKSYRADSPFSNAHNAFRIDVDNPDYWYDYQSGQKGDIVELCRLLYHDGDKRAALMELAPEGYTPQIDKFLKDRRAVQETLTGAMNLLADESQPFHNVFMQYLSDRGITKEQIARCKLGYLNGRLLIPRLDSDGNECIYYSTRRMPHYDAHGCELESEARYMKAATENRPFLARGTKAPLGLQTLKYDSKYLALCEGDIDTLNFENEGFAVLGTGGKINGEILKLVINDSEKREAVLLAFDNDDAGQEYTKKTADDLLIAGVSFKVIKLPDNCKDINDYYRANHDLQKLADDATPGLEYLVDQFKPAEPFDSLSRGRKDTIKKKLKDFLIKVIKAGADKADILSLCEILKNTFSEDWLKEVVRKAEEGHSEYEIVEAMQELHELLYNEKTGFYEYNDKSGIWKKSDDTTIGRHIRDFLSRMATARKINSALDHLKKAVDSETLLTKLDVLPLFAFKNGTLHFNFEELTSNFSPISSNDFVTSRRNYDYDINATCPEWEKALQVIYAGDTKSIMCLQEYSGYCLLNDCRFQKALFLDGEGSNGKSTIIEILRELLGKDNTTSIELSAFADQFSIIGLKGAKLNICTETDSTVKGTFANIKKAISGERLRACFKMRDFIEFDCTAKMIFASNFHIQTLLNGDNSYAMLRRFLVIEHNVKFVEDEPEPGTNEVKKDSTIKQRLMQELPGIFVWAMKGLHRLLKQGHFTMTDATAALLMKGKTDASSISAFIDDVIPSLEGMRVIRKDMYAKYLDYCYHECISEPVSNSKFHKPFLEALKAKGVPFADRQFHGGDRYYEFSTRQKKQEPESDSESEPVIVQEVDNIPPESDAADQQQPESKQERAQRWQEFIKSTLQNKLLPMNFSNMQTSEIKAIVNRIIELDDQRADGCLCYSLWLDLLDAMINAKRIDDYVRLRITKAKIEGTYDTRYNYRADIENAYK